MPDISRSKDNQTLKFGQLIEYNMRNIFLKCHARNVVEKVIPDSFLKNQNWAYYLWINSLNSMPFVFIVWQSRGLPKHVETKVLTTCFYHRAFFKNKKRSETSFPILFSAWFFEEKHFLVRSQCSAIIKQRCSNKAKNGKDQRETLTVKTISTSIFRHVNNYVV